MKNKYTLLALLILNSIYIKAQTNFTSNTIGVGVVVGDIDKSIDFYVNGIGMVKTSSFTIAEDFAKRSGLSNGVSTTVTVLKLENTANATEWKLMSFGTKAAHPTTKFIHEDTGMQYITINVKALKPIIERLKKMGVSLLGESPTPLNARSHFVLVQDPDGTFVELIGPLE